MKNDNCRIKNLLHFSWVGILAIMMSIEMLSCSFSTTPELHKAIKTGDIEQVKQLIAKGADVNATDNKGETPLHFAAVFGHTAIAELLIIKGAKA